MTGHIKNGEQRSCLHCGKSFYLSPAKVRQTNQRNQQSCCSAQCKDAYYTFERSKAFKGGGFKSEASGVVFALVKREGFVGHYVGLHRINAAKALERDLLSSEVILHIDRNKSHNDPANLYLCADRKEFGQIRQGTKPWPLKSNLP
jgi:hypothetical protein